MILKGAAKLTKEDIEKVFALYDRVGITRYAYILSI